MDSRETNEKRIRSLLSIAAKAGKTAGGTEMTIDKVRKGRAAVVLFGTDSSDRTKKVITDKCGYYEVPAYEFSTKESLGRSIGRKDLSAVAVTDENIGREIIKLLV